MKYDPAHIEPKWQKHWFKEKTYKATEDASKKKYYVLDMFPYPSGAGLHVGHLIGYTATDVIARYHWALGEEVLHPMGWDSFGLPAEQYAIRTGTHPAQTTQVNIENFKKQLISVGYAYDWDREIRTSDPSFYKWTQWIFTKLYEKGLAYQAEMLVNWCPALGTVLSNEEVENGLSVEGGHPVERRPLKQWILKITEYAERLLNDLDELDWPEGLKRLQENWIGKSEGAFVDFDVEGEKLRVYTTREDTLFGVSYLAIAPEHPLVKTLTTSERAAEMESYLHKCSLKSDLERTELAKEKTGVFTGSCVQHPVSGKPVPVWVADYVLMNYGTGAVMGVPAHDERDFEFAKKFGLEILPVYPSDGEFSKGEGSLINSKSGDLDLNGLEKEAARAKVGEWLEKHEKGERTTQFKIRDWLFSRQRYWGEPFPLLHLEDGTVRLLQEDELPLTPPEVEDFKPSSTGESPLAKVSDWVNIEDLKTGKKAKRETHTMPQWAGSCWYYLRFCDPQNQKAAWGKENEMYWMPVDLYVGGAEHAVLHLLYSRFWHKVLYDLGYVSTKEPFKKLLNQGLVVSRSFQRKEGGYVTPEEVVQEGEKYFHWESREELNSQIEKMSKSKLNGVSPDDVIEEYGADSMRLYALFLGPIDKQKVWTTEGVAGCRRFLNRIYDLVHSDKVSDEESVEAHRLVHPLIAGVTHDLENLLFNTAIAKMMEFLNNFVKLEAYPKSSLKVVVQLLAPFAPHLAEELWHYLGENESVVHAPWPKVEAHYLEVDQVTYVIQINGKVRARIDEKKGLDKEALLALAKELPMVQKYLVGEMKKVILVPDKLLNIVVA
jgi:leucyl-tRNA synthetase